MSILDVLVLIALGIPFVACLVVAVFAAEIADR